MVNGVPREVPKPKLEGLQVARVLALGLPEGYSLHHDTPKAFPHICQSPDFKKSNRSNKKIWRGSIIG